MKFIAYKVLWNHVNLWMCLQTVYVCTSFASRTSSRLHWQLGRPFLNGTYMVGSIVQALCYILLLCRWPFLICCAPAYAMYTYLHVWKTIRILICNYHNYLETLLQIISTIEPSTQYTSTILSHSPDMFASRMATCVIKRKGMKCFHSSAAMQPD
jgi:hypothetical protein